mmetsp:Transcript_21247/g.44313  ORF Transcript_21247/g.44313 Transcript_21247/m.44313 type:complete len:778 (+) Transcript_21247:104-2437(+)
MTITMTDDNTPANNNTMQIPSSDILHLLQSHLTECGLHATSSSLRAESGGLIGLPGLFPSSKGTLVASCQDGRWGEVLQLLENLDLERSRRSYLEDYSFGIEDNGDSRDDGGNELGQQSSKIITPLEKAVAMAHEMTILELADQNEVDLAYATLRMCSEMMDRSLPLNDDNDDDNNNTAASTIGMISSRSGDVERRIIALSSMRRSSSSNNNTNASSSTTTNTSLLPANYYGPSNPSKQKRRDQIAKLLKRHIPEIPPERLTTLLQQSIKWQCHTGKFPTVQRLFRPTEEDNGDDDEHLADEGDEKKKKKKKKRKDKNAEKKFDLVLGNVDVNDRHGGRKRKRDGEGGGSSLASSERIPSRPYQTIRLGKKSYIESACFLPDGKGLVTGSSDGFIEVWGEVNTASSSSSAPSSRKDGNGGVGVAAAANNSTTNNLNDLNSLLSMDVDFEKLRTSDLPYQRNDDLMMHESSVLAVTVSHDGTLLGTTSSDGTVCVWKMSDGKLLRKMERAHGGAGGVSDKGAAVTCIQFSPDSSKILTGGHDSTCREFGLLASRMLKEFRGHNSYVNCCSYVLLPPSVAGRGAGSGNNGSSRHGADGRFLAVVTASADGSVRLWDGRTAEPIREITPPIPTTVTAVVHDKDSIVRSKSVHTVVHLHSQANAMVVVPRCDRAYLMSYSGDVLRTYVRDDVQGSEFLAAVVGSSERYLFVAADDGKCVVFDIHTGKVEKIIRSFAEDCSSGGRSGKACEISGLVCHPHRGFIGGYSSDKGQKRGILGLWK